MTGVQTCALPIYHQPEGKNNICGRLGRPRGLCASPCIISGVHAGFTQPVLARSLSPSVALPWSTFTLPFPWPLALRPLPRPTTTTRPAVRSLPLMDLHLTPVEKCLPACFLSLYLSVSIYSCKFNRFSGVQKRLRFPKCRHCGGL